MAGARNGSGSGARRLGKQAEHRENKRFSLEIVDLDVAGGAGDCFPYLREARKASELPRLLLEARREPIADGVEERIEGRLVAAERIAERMQRVRVGRRKRCEERAHLLAEREPRAFEQSKGA